MQSCLTQSRREWAFVGWHTNDHSAEHLSATNPNDFASRLWSKHKPLCSCCVLAL